MIAMKDYEKLLEYLINIVKIAKDSTGNIFQIKENSYTKKENSFMEYKLKEKTVSRNINNDRVFPVDNQTLDEFYNETEMNLDYAIIHTGSYADELTRSLHTLALTVGKDIYFRNKAYKPETEEGRKILAHELTHIHQQKKDILKGETTKESLEKEAENTERHFEHQTEKIRTVKIGNNVYKLNEHEYKKFMQDTKNIIEEELESKLRRLDEEESLKLLYTYKEMLENREFIWQQ